MDELIKENKLYSITLNGKEYKLSPVNWGVLSDIEQKFQGGMKGALAEMAEKPYSAALVLAEIFKILPLEELRLIKNHDDIKNINNTVGKILTDFFKGE